MTCHAHGEGMHESMVYRGHGDGIGWDGCMACRGKCVVGGLAHVDVVVGVHQALVPPLPPQELCRPVCNHLRHGGWTGRGRTRTALSCLTRADASGGPRGGRKHTPVQCLELADVLWGHLGFASFGSDTYSRSSGAANVLASHRIREISVASRPNQGLQRCWIHQIPLF